MKKLFGNRSPQRQGTEEDFFDWDEVGEEQEYYADEDPEVSEGYPEEDDSEGYGREDMSESADEEYYSEDAQDGIEEDEYYAETEGEYATAETETAEEYYTGEITYEEGLTETDYREESEMEYQQTYEVDPRQEYAPEDEQGYAPEYAGAYDPEYQQAYEADPGLEYEQGYDPEYAAAYDPEYQQTYEAAPGQEYAPEYEQGYDPEYAAEYDPEYTSEYDPEYVTEYDPEYQEDPELYGAVPVRTQRTSSAKRSTAGTTNRNQQASGQRKPKSSFWNGVINMTVMDRVITVTGVAVLVLALVTGAVYFSVKAADEQRNAFANVGDAIEGIELIGERGLLAVANARLAALEAAQIVEEQQQQEQEEPKEYDENEYTKSVTVRLDMTSIQKDLKIKFVNRDTGKLVSNVPFRVTVTTPNNKTETWSDDDMDGIIYKTEITPGTYKVQVNAIEDEKYRDYALPSAQQNVEVKKDIAYEKVDVQNEVKTEAEVDVKVEDTKVNENIVESTLNDTVEWVESTSTTSTYTEVLKNTIPDPATITVVRSGSFLRAAATGTVSPSAVSVEAGLTATVSAAVSLGELKNITWSSADASVVAVVGNGSSAALTGIAAGTTTVTFKGTLTSVSDGDPSGEVTGSCTVTVTAPTVKGTVTVSPTELNVAANGTITSQAAMSGFVATHATSYQVVSSDPTVATAIIDGTGKITVTGVAAGTASITVTANYTGGADTTAATAVIAVNVTGTLAMTLDQTTATVFLTAPITLNATVTGASVATTPVTAESSDTTVAVVTVNQRAVTVTGLKDGIATITIKYTENEQEVEAKCTVTVKNHPKDDKTTPLVDSSKNQLYVIENDNYREAVYADYYTASKFYIKGDVKYTGWQTIDGKVYYFKADGTKVTGEQVIQGAKYNFASDGSLVTGSGTLGIDVSKWNGNIDWTAVKNSGVSYVIIRCGYRGSSQGALIEDPTFKTNIQGATAAGLKVGVYFFTQAINEVEAVEEASMVLEQVRNYKISYPIFLDVEPSGGRADKIDAATRTAVCKAFCQTIQGAGYTAGIYANKTWLTTKMDASALGAYKIWLAQYAATPTYTGRYDLWQYRSTGKVSGISTDVDMNLSYLGY